MADEPAAKVAKTGDEEEFKVIDGVKYDRKILELIETFAKDGQISYVEVKKIWATAQEDGVVSDCERDTIKYGLATYKFTAKAEKAIKVYLEGGKHKSYTKMIKGVKYDRELLEQAQLYEADGQLSVKEVRHLFLEAQDGKGITGTERNTLEYISKNMKLTEKAREYFDEVIKLPEPTSYYKHVDGKKYDAGLLLVVEDAAKDGTVSLPEAERIWAAAEDGPGVTEIEEATLKYVMELHKSKFTEPALKFLEEKFK